MSVYQNLKTWILGNSSPLPVAVLRVGFGAVTTLTVLAWLPWVSYLFGDKGIVPAQDHGFQASLRVSLFQLNASTTFIYICYFLLLAACVAFTLGWYSQIAAAVVTVLFASFTARTIGVAYGATDVIQVFFFWFIFLKSDATLSLRQRYRKPAQTVPSWPLIALQLQLAALYGGTVWSKIQNPEWTQGHTLWYTLLNPNWTYFNLSFLAKLPGLLQSMTLMTIALEALLPILIWFPQTRRAMVVAGIGLHLGMALLMNIYFFPFIMAAAWLVFLTDEDIALVKGWVKKVHATKLRRQAA
jgi:hypothetical protein